VSEYDRGGLVVGRLWPRWGLLSHEKRNTDMTAEQTSEVLTTLTALIENLML
jgi:hypothetical protein